MLARHLLRASAAVQRVKTASLLQSRSRSLLAPAVASTIVHESPHPELEIPHQTMWDVVERQASTNGDNPAFICGLTHEKVTYRELRDDAKRLAVALAQDGVRKGDAVIVHSFNCMEYPTTVLALASLGAICSPASPMFTSEELAVQITAAEAKFVVTHKELENIALEAAEMTGVHRQHVYTMGGTSGAGERLKSVNELAKKHFDWFEFETIDPSLKVLLPFSSGTTGVPKGVALSGRNMMANVLQVNEVEKLGGHSLGLLPFFHIYGMMLLNLSICQAVPKVILPRFEPESFLNALSKYKMRVAHIAPPLALFLAHHPMVDGYDLSGTEFLVSSGAPMGKEVEALVRNRLKIEVKQLYGMTEGSPAFNYTEDSCRKAGSVGRLIPNTELRIKCTDTGIDLPAGERGELLYRGPQIMLGYSNNPEANASVFTKDGFLRTGDIGYIDEDGFVFIVDRVKELIKYKGHQVAPAELEDVLKNHPKILDACCVRGQDTFGQEVPKAFVVLKDPSDVDNFTAEDVMDYVASKVAPYKKVRQVEFIDAIPKNPSGKMLRRQLQVRENQHHHGL